MHRREHTSSNVIGCAACGPTRPDNATMPPAPSPIKNASCHISNERDRYAAAGHSLSWSHSCLCVYVCVCVCVSECGTGNFPLVPRLFGWQTRAPTKADCHWGLTPWAGPVYGPGRAPEPKRVLDGKFRPVRIPCWYCTARKALFLGCAHVWDCAIVYKICVGVGVFLCPSAQGHSMKASLDPWLKA